MHNYKNKNCDDKYEKKQNGKCKINGELKLKSYCRN